MPDVRPAVRQCHAPDGAAADPGFVSKQSDSVTNRKLNVLFLCTGNSARSILAEAALARWGADRFNAFSAGSHPKGAIHPLAIELLETMRLPTVGLRSKSWSEFGLAGPQLDFVFTVCDSAAAELCPIWPGQPMSAHWGVADPAAVEGTDEQRRTAFKKAYRELEARIKLFVSLPMGALDRTRLQAQLDDIGRGTSA